MMAADLRRQHLVRHLHCLGARALDELLIEIGHSYDIADDILARLERYGRLEPEIVAAVGADTFAPTTFRVAS
jgi:hypothetical protein